MTNGFVSFCWTFWSRPHKSLLSKYSWKELCCIDSYCMQIVPFRIFYVSRRKVFHPIIGGPVRNISHLYKWLHLYFWSPKSMTFTILFGFFSRSFFSDSKHVWFFIAEAEEIYFLGKSFVLFFLFSPLHSFFPIYSGLYYLTIPSITHLLRPSSQMCNGVKKSHFLIVTITFTLFYL